MINIPAIGRVLGILLIIMAGFLLLPLPFAQYYETGDHASFIYSSLISLTIGLIMFFLSKDRPEKVGKREGYLIVAFGWITILLISTLPFSFSGAIPYYTDAVFETVSGMTTTGATIMTDIEAQSKAILFWRSLTQWIGGMGIIVLTIAIFPLLGIGGIELFVAEAPGPTSDKIHPRIQQTAKALWVIYVSLTAILFLLLYLWGMTPYDAVNHALTTMATGGFSTKNASIAAFPNPYIQYTIVVFMFLAGTNYTIIYYLVRAKFRKVWFRDEFRYYLKVSLSIILVIFAVLFLKHDQDLELAFRNSSFQVISIITTTGYVTADYTSWGNGMTLFFFTLLFAGACAGSTSGGIKLVRNLVFFKNSFLEFKRLLHPKAMIRLKIDGQLVPARILTHILVFLLLYLGVFVIGTITIAALGVDFVSAAGAVATSLGNVGPAIGTVGPVDNFAHLSDTVKWILAFLMLLGRLELFTILILFTPYFWRNT